ncbi:MAG: phosphoribosylformylglycinamidine synthase subunit PurL [Myxococcota bacterium]
MTWAENELLEHDAAFELGTSMGLAPSELEAIEKELGRVPTRSELAIFAGMWSEHCSYKSTKHLLKTLPRDSKRLLAGPGAHAGVVDVGEGWAVAFKIESHNHPSAVEPYQGAATGVGGILRDIIAQGARPCLVMDSLAFGMPGTARTQHLEQGIVEGIAGYGNAFGVPNVGGRTVYDDRYDGNPLVNALAAGLIRADAMRTGVAKGAGNAVLYVGAPTGRDGILGAAFASVELADDTVSDRPHVQVGDPFTGKKLMEGCLSFGVDQGMVACQDMGACGITCACTEMAALGSVGMEIDLDQVPLREDDMPAHEILLSESQERFLFVIRAGTEEQALAHFRRHGVQAAIIGRVTDGDRVVVRVRGELCADLPAKMVADETPAIDWPVADAPQAPVAYPPFAPEADLGATLCAMLRLPGIASLEELWSHYDQTVGNRTARGPAAAEAAVMKLPDSKRGFAMTITGRGDIVAAGPYDGARAALGEACRNLACAGAEIIAITDGLNMASPQVPEENRKLIDVIAGLKDGLETLGIPVTGGNVSLYNESKKGPIPPTPMVGAIGIVEDVTRVPAAAVAQGETLFLLGQPSGEPVASRYGAHRSGAPIGEPPSVDLEADKKLAALLVDQCRHGQIAAAKNGGQGGLAVALAKLCLRGGVGAEVTFLETTIHGRSDWWLFGEYPATAWITTQPSLADAFESAARQAGVPIARAGQIGGDRLRMEGLFDVPLGELHRAFAARDARGRSR